MVKSSRHIANLLTRVTGDPLSARTVQSWSAAPGLVSARPCPGWVLYILENELQILAEEHSSNPSFDFFSVKTHQYLVLARINLKVPGENSLIVRGR